MIPDLSQRRIERTARVLRSISDTAAYDRAFNRFIWNYAKRLERYHGDEEAASYAVRRDLAAFHEALSVEIVIQESGVA